MGGLVPDWSAPDGGNIGDKYHTEACRAPWRIAMDYGLSGNASADAALAKFHSYVKGKGGLTKVPFALDKNTKNSCFIGGLALASLGETQSDADDAVRLWIGSVTGDTLYYQTTLKILYLGLAAGRVPAP
jgi:hypothetical protein